MPEIPEIWMCERHPWETWEHDNCGGAGMLLTDALLQLRDRERADEHQHRGGGLGMSTTDGDSTPVEQLCATCGEGLFAFCSHPSPVPVHDYASDYACSEAHPFLAPTAVPAAPVEATRTAEARRTAVRGEQVEQWTSIDTWTGTRTNHHVPIEVERAIAVEARVRASLPSNSDRLRALEAAVREQVMAKYALESTPIKDNARGFDEAIKRSAAADIALRNLAFPGNIPTAPPDEDEDRLRAAADVVCFDARPTKPPSFEVLVQVHLIDTLRAALSESSASTTQKGDE